MQLKGPWTKLIVVVMLATPLSSSTSYKVKTKNHPVNKVLLSQLKVKKNYKFYLASGAVLKVLVDSVENERVHERMLGLSRDKPLKEASMTLLIV